jgi:hypothetical protein
MRGRIIAAVMAAIALEGCAPTGPSPAAVAYNSEWATCEAIKGAVARITCENSAIDRYVRPHSTNQDLITLDEAQRLALAEKLDAGTITVAEADLQYAQSHSANVSEAQRRANNAEIAGAATMGAMPLPETCHSYGNGVGLTTTCY